MGEQESRDYDGDTDSEGGELRGCERVKVGIKLTLGRAVDDATPDIVRSALSRDLSRTGIACTTQHELEEGEAVSLDFSTQGSPVGMGLPERLYGSGRVVRVEQRNSSTRLIAIQFEEAFSQKMEFGFFMAWLLGRQPRPDFA